MNNVQTHHRGVKILEISPSTSVLLNFLTSKILSFSVSSLLLNDDVIRIYVSLYRTHFLLLIIKR